MGSTVTPKAQMARIIAFLALCASASAFNTVAPQARAVAPSAAVSRPLRAAPAPALSMNAGRNAAAKAAALIPMITALPAFAEGTGEALGISDSVILYHELGVVATVFILFAKWSGEQDDTDFFDSYDQRERAGEAAQKQIQLGARRFIGKSEYLE